MWAHHVHLDGGVMWHIRMDKHVPLFFFLYAQQYVLHKAQILKVSSYTLSLCCCYCVIVVLRLSLIVTIQVWLQCPSEDLPYSVWASLSVGS